MTLILKSDKALSNPLANNPILANLTKNLILDYTFDRYRNAIPNGSTISSISSEGEMSLTLAAKIASLEYPTLVHSGPNGYAALEFKGNHMIGHTLDTTTIPVIFAANEPGTFAAVLKPSASSTSSERIIGVDQNLGFRYIAPSEGGAGLRVATDGGSTEVAAAVNKWHSIVVVFNGKDSKVQVDGGTVKTVTFSNSNFSGLRLGHTGGGAKSTASAYNGQLAQVSMFKRVLSFEEINALSSALITKYGIPKSAV